MFFLKRRELNIVREGWLKGMVDVHCHLLPGVDDGARSMDESRALLQALGAVGVENFIFTPHIYHRYPQNNSISLCEHFDAFLEELSMPEVSIRLAAEYMIDDQFEAHLDEPLLTLGDSRYLLFEFSFAGAPMDYPNSIRSIRSSGAKPLLAHPERYLYFSTKEYEDLKDLGASFQLNLFSLTGMYGEAVQKRARQMLLSGFYDFVGTDTHRKEKFDRVTEQPLLPRRFESHLTTLMENNRTLLAPKA